MVDLRTSEQLMLLSSVMAPHTLALIGRVLGALLLYGLIGSLISGLVCAFAGLVWVKAIKAGLEAFYTVESIDMLTMLHRYNSPKLGRRQRSN
jgi:hypothetical protein